MWELIWKVLGPASFLLTAAFWAGVWWQKGRGGRKRAQERDGKLEQRLDELEKEAPVVGLLKDVERLRADVDRHEKQMQKLWTYLRPLAESEMRAGGLVFFEREGAEEDAGL